MNWLTLLLSDPEPSIAVLSEQAGRNWDEQLRVVPYWSIAELAGLPAGPPELTRSFLLCETSEDAQERRSTAAYVGGPQSAESFTLALDAGQGTVFYLPEESSDELRLQLFNSYGGLLGVVDAQAEFGEGLSITAFGEPQQYIPALVNDCSAGPCNSWGADCSPPELGCACHLQDVNADLVYGRTILESTVSGWTLKCVRP